ANMRRPRRLRAPTRACVSLLARWQESRREMATGQARDLSIYQSVVLYRKSAVTNHVRAAAGKNTRTDAVKWRKNSHNVKTALKRRRLKLDELAALTGVAGLVALPS